MSTEQGIVTRESLQDIADGIRYANGANAVYKPEEMGEAIRALKKTLGTKNVTANGNYSASSDSLDGYSSVNVAVQLNLQSKTATQNGTVIPDQGYDGLSSVVVNVSGGGGSDGVYVGTDVPDASIGSNGDYYYQRELKGEFGYTSTPAQNSGTSQTGYEFIANEAIAVLGLRALNIYASVTISLLLARLDGTVLGRIDNVQTNGGWTEAYFDTPIQLTAGEHYIVQAIRSSGTGFLYQSKSSTAFNLKITGVQGRYGGLPGSTDSSNIYSADIIIGAGDDYMVTKQYRKKSDEWVQIA